jgi:hypothetical protein
LSFSSVFCPQQQVSGVGKNDITATVKIEKENASSKN